MEQPWGHGTEGQVVPYDKLSASELRLSPHDAVPAADQDPALLHSTLSTSTASVDGSYRPSSGFGAAAAYGKGSTAVAATAAAAAAAAASAEVSPEVSPTQEDAREIVPLPLLLPDAAAELAAALPEGMLPSDWTSYPTWRDLEKAVQWAVAGMTRTQPRKMYNRAKQRAQQLSLASLPPAVEMGAKAAAAAAAALSKVSLPAPAGASAAAAATPPAAAARAVSTGLCPHLTPGSAAWSAALQQLLSGGAEVKWRLILPDGDRVGPVGTSELQRWLLKGGPAPTAVGSAGARQVHSDQGSLQLCGIAARDYNIQRLPGELVDNLAP